MNRSDISIGDIVIRAEKEDDRRKVENLIREAFWNVYRPGCCEHYLITVLRGDPAFVRELDLVMEAGGRIIGQNVFAEAVIEADSGENVKVLTMGPICVSPELQRMGLGKRLLDFSLDRSASLGYGAVLIEGNIAFYGKSGFVPAAGLGIRYNDLPADADTPFFLCRELTPGYLSGVTGAYRTPECYYVSGEDAERFDRSFPPKKKLKLPGQLE